MSHETQSTPSPEDQTDELKPAEERPQPEARKHSDERKQAAEELKKAKQWAAAAELYHQMWTEKKQGWDGYFWARCLRESGDSAAALDACRAIYPELSDFKPVRGIYALCIYDLEIKGLRQIQNEKSVFKALNAIKNLSEAPEEAGEFNLVNVAVWKVIKIFKERVNFPAETMLKLTDMLDPNAQEKKCFVTEDEYGKKIELASKHEEYYMIRSKALYELKRYQECIDCCVEAITTLEKFHYDNDVWFKMRIARAGAELGDVPGAIKQLESLLTKRREWFIQRNLAEWNLKTGNQEKALKYILDAALNHGDPDKKISVYKAATEIFSHTGRDADAKRMAEFIAAIYNDLEKKFEPETTQLLQKHGVAQDRKADLKKELQNLKRRWEEMLAELVPPLSGTIKKMTPDGQAGFIVPDDKNGKESKIAYYFKLKDVKGKKEDVVPGAKVTFVIEKGYDKKKDRESEVAAKVRLKK